MDAKLKAAWDELAACKDADAVADLMRRQKVRGERHEPDACPVSNFLRSVPGVVYAGVDEVEIAVEVEGREPVSLWTPAAVASFERRFDNGCYSDLDKQ